MAKAPASPETVRSPEGHAFELRPIDCPTCGPAPSKTYVGMRGGRHHRYGFGVETPIVRCDRCHLLFPNPFPFPVDPQTLYGDPAKYFETHDLPRKVEVMRRLIRGFQSRLGRRELSLLDVGSGRGEVLGAAKAEGLTRMVGLELSAAMIAMARQTFHVEVLPVLVEEYAQNATEPFDVVVLNAILEHVYDPDAMIAACRRLLTDDGLLYLDLPNEHHLLARVAGTVNRWRGRPEVFVLAPTFPPYHVFGFSPHALRVLLEKHRLAVQELQVRGGVKVPSRGDLKDRAASLAGTAINVLANRLGQGHNMFVWARPRS